MESIFECRRRVFESVQNGIVDRRVVDCIVHGGIATDDESPLWDYKLELPVPPAGKNDALQSAYSSKSAEIVKDCVSLYNSYGGYIVSGIRDTDRVVIGTNYGFDAADLNQKIHGATGVSIETVYREVDVSDVLPDAKIGLLFVPRRPNNCNPAQFKKDAPRGNGKLAYQAQSFYLRQRDTCRPAATPEDFEFLYGSRELENIGRITHFLENNLPSREQDFERLIGRDEEMAALWAWLSDAFSPIKILSGLGGVGKTSIAYTFAERLIVSSAAGLDRLIWLGAKSETFSGERDALVPLSRVDFSGVDELLTQILLETGCPPAQLPEEAGREDLLEMARSQLGEFSFLLVVDNVDTLPDADQQLLFHLLTQICSATRTKCIVTARRNLGAPRTAFIEIEGLLLPDFEKFVAEKASLMKVAPPPAGSRDMRKFHEDSGGSPLFAMSVLRLMSLGDSMRDALSNWRGSDGEAVREAAFRREIGRLKRKEARVLLALCYLGSASSVELAAVLGLTRYEIQEALEELRSFAMTSLDASLPGGATFKLSPTLALVTGLVEQRVPDHAEIKGKTKKLTKVAANKKPYIGEAVLRTIAYLEQGDTSSANNVVQTALQTLPDDPDLLCLLGRCLEAQGDRPKAKEVFQKAHDLGCRRRELFFGWIKVVEEQEDWNGMISVAELAEDAIKSCRFRLARNRARAELGHERSRAGDYRGAIEFYEDALVDLHAALEVYQLSPDRADLWKQNDQIVGAWLGAVRMAESSSGGDGRRLFSAYWRAITTYRIVSRAAFSGALDALSDWLGRVEGRRVLSETARDNLELASTRVRRIAEIAEARVNFEAGAKTAFQASAARARARLVTLLKGPMAG
ncbi:AAA family ATPase [Sphingosinicella sp. YJ22]|uniref:AAA family ATPase n=1 Tax=Sphingosinicella sp. YJ22 TaxID=1104780 RepID=UPI00140879EC|nr:AAA family ATPase [Sphingosinicella sp. YJ22]